jgi:hypothetical protein
MQRWLLPIGLVAATAAGAQAAPCDQLPNPIYIQAGDTQTNLLKNLGRALRDNTARPITLVFLSSGSCTNIDAIYKRVPITATMSYIPSIAENPTWKASDPPLTCTPPTGGVVPDVANSALFNSACTSDTAPATVHLQQGPVQAYVMAVPEASSQTSITFEEAYFVFGFGSKGMVSPWDDESQMFIRTITKSTLLAWAANISVAGDKWKGIKLDKSTDVVNGLLTSPTPEKAIGILGAEVYDGLRDKLNVLAYRAKNQYAAYYPDSTSTSRDKKNLRDGHYTVWSPTIWMDTTDGGGVPVKADTRYVLDLISGKAVTPVPNFDMFKIITDVGLVPDCAMGVNRTFEGGPLQIYKPTQSCVCKYESLVDTTACAACDGSTPCASGTCRNGYCEVR